MSRLFKDVHKFLSACGQDIPPFPVKDYAQSELYKKLIDEEYEEFQTAWDSNDEVEKVDACFDMLWVIIGYMKSRGWDCEGIWNEGSDSNLAKIDPTTGKVIKREDGKVMKPAGWQPPDFKKFA